MKKVAAIIFLSVVFAAATSAQKIAHVNLDSLLSLMPESKAAKKAGEEHLKQLESTIQTMQAELQTKYQEYMENQTKYSELIKQNKEKELQDLQQRIQDFQVSAQQDLQKKNEELARPVYDKAKKAIDQVAKENGYKYVLDTSQGMVLYSEPADDILALVKKKLNLTGAATPSNAPKTEGK